VKIDTRRAAAFLRDPGACRVVLLHGDDGGLIRERADGLTRLVAGAADDPFRVAELDRDASDRLEDEACALSMTGGRRVVRVRDVTDGLTDAVKAVLAGRGEALVLLEAPGLGKSRLRSLAEAAPEAAAVGCYPETGETLEATIRSGLAALGVGAEPEAVSWLATQFGADRGATRRELEKLAAYGGEGGVIDLQAARACAGDQAALSLDDALFAATAGDAATTARALEQAMAEGATPVGVLRAALMHVQRLHRMRLAMGPNRSAAEAVKAARPPVFFRRAAAMTRALELWPGDALLALLGRLLAAEHACKQTGAPAEAICRDLLLRVARPSPGRRGRAGSPDG
jgi:DNA polymerase-3 subunit delta